MRPWGFHLCLDIARCYSPAIKCPVHISNFSKALVKNINMEAYGEPQVVYFGTENKAGLTLVQLITTSNITAHFCEETSEGYIDIFSCKEFDKEKAKEVVNEYFMPLALKEHYIERQAPFVIHQDLP